MLYFCATFLKGTGQTHCVTVAHRILVPFVKVRILVGLLKKANHLISQELGFFAFMGYLFTRGIRNFAVKAFIGGCVKSISLALRAKLYFDGYVIFAISLRKIAKIMYPSKEYSAAAA